MLRFFSVLLFVAASIPAWALAGQKPAIVGPLHIIDGDTVSIHGKRIRLIGIDAPERKQACATEHGVSWDCGQWVRQTLLDRFESHRASCVGDKTDRYGRLLAHCTVEGRDLGRFIVENGLAFAYRKYSMEYVSAEKTAAVVDAGLWAMRVQQPSAFRSYRVAEQKPSDPACRIKGNISIKGVKIYHVPGQKYYGKTRINTAKGERWFCSEKEARAAGWRKSKI